jgi:hypothetical protein
VNIQFIIVTNSSALINKAATEELSILMPSEQLAKGSNQLVKVSEALHNHNRSQYKRTKYKVKPFGLIFMCKSIIL